ncbi:4Fe-4S binding protein [[Eubacterium] cellulosolvens]
MEEGRVKCVGCGRCIRACPVDIDITEVAAIIRGDK